MSRIWDPVNIQEYWQKTLHRYSFIQAVVTQSGYAIRDTQISSSSSKADLIVQSSPSEAPKPENPHNPREKKEPNPVQNEVTHKVIHNPTPKPLFRIELLTSQEIRELADIWSSLNDCIWGDPGLLGWIRQFFHLEELDQAIRRGQTLKPADLPVATQLFTPRWIARFLAENTLLEAWKQSGLEVPNTLQIQPWSPENFHDTQDSEVISNTQKSSAKPIPIRDTQVSTSSISKFDTQTNQAAKTATKTSKIFDTQTSETSPQPVQALLELEVCDPACGAGHLLIEAFDVWLELGRSIIPKNQSLCNFASYWLNSNCVGLDIDPGVTWIAKWGLVRKLELEFPELDHGQTLKLNPRIHSISSPGHNHKEILNSWPESRFATEVGSLLRPPQEIISQLKPKKDHSSVAQENNTDMDAWIEILSRKFDIVISNPPYMQNRSLPPALKDLAKKRVPKGKTDLFALFLDQGLHLLRPNGQLGLLTMQSWMFLKSFSHVRQKLMEETTVRQLAHIGPGAFEDLGAFNALTAAFTVTKRICPISIESLPIDEKTIFFELNHSPDIQKKWDDFHQAEKRHELSPATFLHLPDQRWIYQLPAQAIQNFKQQAKLGQIARPRQGLATTDNQRFVRRWFEIPKSKIGFGFPSSEAARTSGFQWFPYNKGGKFRRWYGANEFVVRYENDGQVLMDLARKKYPRVSDPEFVIKNRPWYFREGIVWSLFGFERFSVRYKESGYIFDVSGASAFPEKKDLHWVLAYLSSNVALYYLKALAPTVNFQVGDLASIPCIAPKPAKIAFIHQAVQTCIDLCRTDWNERQISWNFDPSVAWTDRLNHPQLHTAWQNRSEEITQRRELLRQKEALIHREFIQLHQLEKHVSPITPESDLSLPAPDVREACRETLSRILLELGDSPPWNSPEAFQTMATPPLWTLHLPDREIMPMLRLPKIVSNREIIQSIHFWIHTNWPQRNSDECLEFLAQASTASGSKRSPNDRIQAWLKSQWSGYHSSSFSKCPPLWSIQSQPGKFLQVWIPYWNITRESLKLTLNDLIHPLISAIRKRPFTDSTKVLNELDDFRARIEHCANHLPKLQWTDGITSNLQLFDRLFGATS